MTINRGIYVRGFYSFKNIKIQIKEPVRRKFNIKTNQITSFKEQLNYNVCKLLFKKSTNIRFKIDVQKYIMTFCKNNYKLSNRFNHCQELLRDLNIITQIFDEKSTLFRIQEESFQMRLENAKKINVKIIENNRTIFNRVKEFLLFYLSLKQILKH